MDTPSSWTTDSHSTFDHLDGARVVLFHKVLRSHLLQRMVNRISLELSLVV